MQIFAFIGVIVGTNIGSLLSIVAILSRIRGTGLAETMQRLDIISVQKVTSTQREFFYYIIFFCQILA